MTTDPIADMLTRIRNAARAKHPRVDLPASLLKVEIDSLLEADNTFKELLGRDVAPRYKFIMESAAQVVTEELDV